MNHYWGRIINDCTFEISDLTLWEIKDYINNEIFTLTLSEISNQKDILPNFFKREKIYYIRIYKDVYNRQIKEYWIECYNKEEAENLMNELLGEEKYSF